MHDWITIPFYDLERSFLVALNRTQALTMTGAALMSALMLSTAVAKPPKKAPHKKPPVVKASPAAGKKVYASNGCGGCHKIGENGGTNGPELTKYADDKTHDAKWTMVQIQDPKKHKADSAMPPYGGKIKGKDLNNLAAYLLTLKS
jgi:mono/diheme cytochrome c family protein